MSEKEEEKRVRYAVYLSKLLVQNYKSFRGLHELDLTDGNGNIAQWTVFMGNNNSGKTNLLKAIADMEPSKVEYDGRISFVPSNHRLDTTGEVIVGQSYSIGSQLHYAVSPQQPDGLNASFSSYPSDLNFPEVFSNYYSFTSFGMVTNAGSHPFFNDFRIYGYGTTRRTGIKGLGGNDHLEHTNTLFNPEASLINLEDWLLQLELAYKNNPIQGGRVFGKIRELICSSIFPDLEDFKTDTTHQLVNRVLFKFKDHDGWHTFSELGYGYQSSLAWLIDFCRKMFLRYPDSPNPWAEPAICLVDEIDLHLHPTWQRTIIRDLSKMFPATQFIVTTHSPLVIQSMENINLYVLTREKDGVKVTHAPKRTYFGWTVEEILTELMENPEGGYSDRYLRLMQEFNTALRKGDKRKAQEVFDLLASELHPASADKTIMKLQLSQLTGDDQTDERRTAS